MANETVSTNKNWTALVAGHASGDTISITSGAELTLDQTAFGNSNAAANLLAGVKIDNTAGVNSKFTLRNTSTSQALRYYGPYTSTLQVKSGCILDIQGGYISIYTGDGTVSQTTSGWTVTAQYDKADEPGCIEVQKLNYFEVEIVKTNTIAVGDSFTNNSSTFTVTSVLESVDATLQIIVLHRTSGSNDPSAGSTTFTLSAGSGATFTSTWDFFYEAWLNLADLAFSDIGLNALGNWFKFDNTTGVISFGDGGNATAGKGGNKPASGANVRVYNIGIGSSVSAVPSFNATNTSNYALATNNGGVIILKKCYFFGFYLQANRAQSVIIDRVGCTTDGIITTMYNIAMNRIYFGCNRYNASNRSLEFSYNTKGVFKNSKIAHKDKDFPCYISSCADGYMTDCEVFICKRTADGYRTALAEFSPNWIYKNSKFAGGTIFHHNGSDNGKVLNCQHSDSMFNASAGSHYNPVHQANQCIGIVIDGLTLMSDGFAPSSVGALFQTTNNYTILNVNYAHSNNYFAEVFGNYNFKCARCVVGTPASAVFHTAGGSSGFDIQDITLSSGSPSVPICTANNEPTNSVMRHVDSVQNQNIAASAVLNTIFWEFFVGSSTGALSLLFSPQSSDKSFYAITGSSIVFDYGGSLFFITDAGDSIIYEWPAVILGVTSFQNTAPTLVGGNTGRLTLQYAIDTLNGSGYSSFKTLSGANLSGESISATTGFKLKIKILKTSGQGTDRSTSLSNVRIQTNVDKTVQYREFTGAIVLQNIVSGSTYRVDYGSTNHNDSTLIAQGTAGAGNITIAGVQYNDGDTITVRVRKSSTSVNPDYLPYESQAIMQLTLNGVSVFVQQVQDLVST